MKSFKKRGEKGKSRKALFLWRESNKSRFAKRDFFSLENYILQNVFFLLHKKMILQNNKFFLPFCKIGKTTAKETRLDFKIVLDKLICLVYNKAKTEKGAGENDHQ